MARPLAPQADVAIVVPGDDLYRREAPREAQETRGPVRAAASAAVDLEADGLSERADAIYDAAIDPWLRSGSLHRIARFWAGLVTELADERDTSSTSIHPNLHDAKIDGARIDRFWLRAAEAFGDADHLRHSSTRHRGPRLHPFVLNM